MRRLASVLIVVSIVVMAVPAYAMNWSLGANLGLSIFMPDYTGAENLTEFSWPSGLMGLRVGFAGANPQHEFYVDTGLAILSQKPFSSNSFEASGNYQYNWSSTGSAVPYVTAGAGLVSEGFDDGSPGGNVSAMSAIFGGGLGLRHKMGNGHGTMRAEARFDVVTEGKDGAVLVIPKGNLLRLKLGFDLWD